MNVLHQIFVSHLNVPAFIEMSIVKNLIHIHFPLQGTEFNWVFAGIVPLGRLATKPPDVHIIPPLHHEKGICNCPSVPNDMDDECIREHPVYEPDALVIGCLLN